MKKIQAIVYSILSLALSGFCIYKIIDSKDAIPSMNFHVTDNKIINCIIDMAIKFADNFIDNSMTLNAYVKSFLFLGIGISALLFYVLFADTMHEFFSQIPLGSIRKFDCLQKSKKGRVIKLLLPSVFIGIYTGIHSILYRFLPEKLDFCIKWIFPATIILVSIAFLALIITVMLEGGLWGIIVRTPLIFITNLCFSLIMGELMMLGVFAIIMLLVNSLWLIAIIIMCLFPKTTTKTEYEIYYQ